MIPNQKELWENLFGKGDLKREPSELAKKVVKMTGGGKLLELGGGTGTDALFFLRAGFEVHVVELTETGSAYLRKKAPEAVVYTGDMRKILPKLPSSEFAVVYSNLALHYFTSRDTAEIFKNIHRVLTPGGILAFSVKSTSDPLYGKGTPLEKDFYYLNGHIHHFFDRGSIQELLRGYEILEMKESTKTHETGEKFVAWSVIARLPRQNYQGKLQTQRTL